MKYKKGKAEITIDFSGLEDFPKSAQKKRYRIEEDNNIHYGMNHVKKIDLPQLKGDLYWELCVDRVYLPSKDRVKGFEYRIKLMLAIVDGKSLLSKSSIIEFDQHGVTKDLSIDKIIEKIRNRAISICGTFVGVNVDTAIKIKSKVINSGEQSFIETHITSDMEENEVAQRVAELFSIFKDRHAKSFSDRIESEKKHLNPRYIKPIISNDEVLFDIFLNLLEVAQNFEVDGISYQKNFPILGALKIVSSDKAEDVLESFKNNYLNDLSGEGMSFYLRIYDDPNSMTGMDYHPSYYPMAEVTSESNINKIKSLKDFDNAVNFLQNRGNFDK